MYIYYNVHMNMFIHIFNIVANIYIYIYIYIYRQTISLYYNSSVWLDPYGA